MPVDLNLLVFLFLLYSLLLNVLNLLSATFSLGYMVISLFISQLIINCVMNKTISILPESSTLLEFYAEFVNAGDIIK